MDLRLRELTLKRLLSLLVWTLLVILKRGISVLIESIESCIFERTTLPPDRNEGRRRGGLGRATLLPPLNDELVLSHIWPRLHRRVNISLLWRLRRVSRAWKEGVGTTREWAALEMVRLDRPGLAQYLVDHCECRPSLRDLVESEMESINFLLSECLEDFSVQSEVGSVEIVEDEDLGRWSSSASSVESLDYVFIRGEHPRGREFAF